MKYSLMLFVILLPLTAVLAQDWDLVVVPTPNQPETLTAQGFQLFGIMGDYWVGTLPEGRALPSGGKILSGYNADQGELYQAVLASPTEAEKLVGQVNVLFQTGSQLLIQATMGQLAAFSRVKAEWMWIPTQPKAIFPSKTTSSPPPSSDQFAPVVSQMVDSVSQLQYTSYMLTLEDFVTRNTFKPNCDSAALWILSQFQSFGLDAYLDPFLIWNADTTLHVKYNVVGELPGLIFPDSVVFITGHYDATAGNQFPTSWNPGDTLAPGANDNASGTSCVLECARVLSQYAFEKTIRFVAFAGEEQGLVGSYYYVWDLDSLGTAVVGCFNWDMIAYPTPGTVDFDIYANYDPRSQAMAYRVQEAFDTFVPGAVNASVYINPNAGGSDHYFFWWMGWPAILGIEGPAYYYPYYHTIYDLVSQCNLTYATNCTKAAIAALADYGGPLGEGTEVAGGVSGVWTSAGNPYYVTAPIYVPANGSLTIEPGVFVLFDGEFPLEVLDNATLRAVGTVTEPILFLPLDSEDSWGGIRFLSAAASSQLEFCQLRHGWAQGAGPQAYGGAIFCDNTSPTLEHCLITNNQAENGGAIACVNQSHPTLNFLTISGNEAELGGALYCLDSNPIISNCIIWGNSLPEITGAGGSNPQVSYSDVQGGWAGIGNLNLDPYFINAAENNYRLQTTINTIFPNNSPCLDAGDPTASYANEPEPNGDRVDMGYYGNTVLASLSPNDPHWKAGEVSGIWTAAANNPVHLIGNATIPAGESLEIEPGVEIIVEGYFFMTVAENATLKAVGTPQDSIIFTTTNLDSGWHGIHFNSASDSSHLEYCQIHLAKALGGTANGGGISCLYSNPTLRFTTLDSCLANNGGGIYLFHSDPLLDRCFLRDNTAINKGGGLYADSSSQPIIRGCEFSGNHASDGGALAFYWQSGGTLENNLIQNNSANGNAGGLYSFFADLSVINTTIVDNSSSNGSAIFAVSFAPIQIKNCIVWGNSSPSLAIPGAAVTYCDLQDTTITGTGNIFADPLFVADSLGDFHLLPNSPCIDHGDPDPMYNDPEDPFNLGFALYPAQGLLRNDMGVYGGAGAGWLVGIPEGKNPVASTPSAFGLEQNYPNPFNPITAISYELRAASHVSLRVYDTAGRLAATLVEGWRVAGEHRVTFNGAGLPSGIYFCHLQAGDFAQVRKMVLLK